MLESKFRWLRDDTFLIARVDDKTGHQQLVMQQIALDTGNILHEDAIDCIHVAVCDVPRAEFKTTVQGEDFSKTVLDLQSSEDLLEINLSPKEKFKALTSWVGGIAEAGEGAFYIQAEIEAYARLAYPFTRRLLRFAVHVDPSFLVQYLEDVYHDCQYEGVLHHSSFRANLIPIMAVIQDLPYFIACSVQVLEAVCEVLEQEITPGSDQDFNLSLAWLWSSLGDAWESASEDAKAASAYERALKIVPWLVRVWHKLGEVWFRLQEYKKAISAFNVAIGYAPQDLFAWYYTGKAYSKIGNLCNAARAFKKCLKIDPRYSYAWFSLGFIRREQQNLEGAIIAWEKAILFRQYDAQLWQDLGEIYEKKGNLLEAQRCHKQANLLLNPSRTWGKAKYKRAWAYAKKRSWRNRFAGKSRQGIRAERTASLKRGQYDNILDLRAIGRRWRGTKDAKSNRNHDGTRRKEAYRTWGRNKRLEQPVDFLTVLAH